MAKKDSETHEPEVEDLEPVDDDQDAEIEDDDPAAFTDHQAVGGRIEGGRVA